MAPDRPQSTAERTVTPIVPLVIMCIPHLSNSNNILLSDVYNFWIRNVKIDILVPFSHYLYQKLLSGKDGRLVRDPRFYLATESIFSNKSNNKPNSASDVHEDFCVNGPIKSLNVLHGQIKMLFRKQQQQSPHSTYNIIRPVMLLLDDDNDRNTIFAGRLPNILSHLDAVFRKLELRYLDDSVAGDADTETNSVKFCRQFILISHVHPALCFPNILTANVIDESTADSSNNKNYDIGLTFCRITSQMPVYSRFMHGTELDHITNSSADHPYKVVYDGLHAAAAAAAAGSDNSQSEQQHLFLKQPVVMQAPHFIYASNSVFIPAPALNNAIDLTERIVNGALSTTQPQRQQVLTSNPRAVHAVDLPTPELASATTKRFRFESNELHEHNNANTAKPAATPVAPAASIPTNTSSMTQALSSSSAPRHPSLALAPNLARLLTNSSSSATTTTTSNDRRQPAEPIESIAMSTHSSSSVIPINSEGNNVIIASAAARVSLERGRVESSTTNNKFAAAARTADSLYWQGTFECHSNSTRLSCDCDVSVPTYPMSSSSSNSSVVVNGHACGAMAEQEQALRQFVPVADTWPHVMRFSFIPQKVLLPQHMQLIKGAVKLIAQPAAATATAATDATEQQQQQQHLRLMNLQRWRNLQHFMTADGGKFGFAFVNLAPNQEEAPLMTHNLQQRWWHGAAPSTASTENSPAGSRVLVLLVPLKEQHYDRAFLMIPRNTEAVVQAIIHVKHSVSEWKQQLSHFTTVQSPAPSSSSVFEINDRNNSRSPSHGPYMPSNSQSDQKVRATEHQHQQQQQQQQQQRSLRNNAAAAVPISPVSPLNPQSPMTTTTGGNFYNPDSSNRRHSGDYYAANSNSNSNSNALMPPPAPLPPPPSSSQSQQRQLNSPATSNLITTTAMPSSYTQHNRLISVVSGMNTAAAATANDNLSSSKEEFVIVSPTTTTTTAEFTDYNHHNNNNNNYYTTMPPHGTPTSSSSGVHYVDDDYVHSTTATAAAETLKVSFNNNDFYADNIQLQQQQLIMTPAAVASSLKRKNYGNNNNSNIYQNTANYAAHEGPNLTSLLQQRRPQTMTAMDTMNFVNSTTVQNVKQFSYYGASQQQLHQSAATVLPITRVVGPSGGQVVQLTDMNMSVADFDAQQQQQQPTRLQFGSAMQRQQQQIMNAEFSAQQQQQQQQYYADSSNNNSQQQLNSNNSAVQYFSPQQQQQQPVRFVTSGGMPSIRSTNNVADIDSRNYELNYAVMPRNNTLHINSSANQQQQQQQQQQFTAVYDTNGADSSFASNAVPTSSTLVVDGVTY